MNYAKRLPRDISGESMTNFPSNTTANATYQKENGVASSVITLHPMTSQIEVGAFGGQGAVIRWIPATETAAVSPFASVIASGVGANFTHWVPPSTYRQFVVPKETQGQPVGQVGSVNGLYGRVAVINGGATAASILVSEY